MYMVGNIVAINIIVKHTTNGKKNTVYESSFKSTKLKLASLVTFSNFLYIILANHYIIFMQYEIRLF